MGYNETTSLHAHNYAVELMLEGVLYMLMVFMTVDRLCAVLLSFRYPQYWGVDKTKITLVTIWSIGFLVLVCFQILTHFFGVLYAIEEIIYISVTATLLFVLVALVTYVVIFWKFKRSRDSMRSHQGNEPQGTAGGFVKAKFYIPVLIISSYLVFAAIPYIWSIGLYIGGVAIDSDTEITIITLWVTGYMCDGIVYIFLQRAVRKQLWVLLTGCCNTGTNDTGISSSGGRSDTTGSHASIVTTNV